MDSPQTADFCSISCWCLDSALYKHWRLQRGEYSPLIYPPLGDVPVSHKKLCMWPHYTVQSRPRYSRHTPAIQSQAGANPALPGK